MTEATPKYCAACGTPFADESPTGNRRFCCRRCWRRAKERRSRGVSERDVATVSDCVACGASLAGRPHGTRHCSNACYQRARRRERLGQPIADRAEEIACRRCGDLVYRQHWSFTLYCSKRCREAYNAYRYFKMRRPEIERACLACGAPISPDDTLSKKYCDRRCAGRNRSPDVIFRYVNARRALLSGATARRVPKRVLRRLRSAICFYCGSKANTVDHVVPLSRGGQHAEGNLVPACRSCNSSKADKLLIEWRLWRRGRELAERRSESSAAA